MSKLQHSADTIKKLGLTGIGIDEVAYKLNIFHQLEPKIIMHKVALSTVNSGTYYIEGDVTDFLDGYTNFWITSRELIDGNLFQIDSAIYDPSNFWTVVVVTLSASYVVNFKDNGFNICGVADITSILKDVGRIENKLAEDGSIGNAVSTTFDFTINDENRDYFDRANRSGFFYSKDIITEVKSIASESSYSAKSGVHTTFLKVNNLTSNYTGSDFVNGYVELITGDAAGSRAVISEANGYNLKTLGFYAKSLDDIYDYHLKVKDGDQIRVFKSDTFWFKLDMWVRSELEEKIGVVCGKLDLDTVDTDDKQRLLSVRGNCTIKDLFNKKLSSLDFDNGHNLNRLTEMKTLMIDSVPLRLMKHIHREPVSNNPLASVDLKQVGFDVAEGWHIIDFNPYANLFRFDLGKWFQVIDEGSFEKSTKSVFISSNDDANTFINPAKLPAHDGIFMGESKTYGNTPPVTPVLDSWYLVGSAPTGIWSNMANMKVIRLEFTVGFITGEFYQPVTPIFGERWFNTGDSTQYVFDGSVWTADLDAVNNKLMERNWHGKWGSINIKVEDDFHLGSASNSAVGSGNTYWKKLSGLPDYPYRMLVYVDNNRQITFQNNFGYSYDNGNWVTPNYLFDYIEAWDSSAASAYKDLTYALGFGIKKDYVSGVELPLESIDDTKNLNLRCYSHSKFNGILTYFQNEGNNRTGSDEILPLSYSNYIDSLFRSLRIRFTNGTGYSVDANLIYTGGTVSAVVDDRQFTLTIDAIDTDVTDLNYTDMDKMYILSINGDNFLQKRKILSISITAGTIVEYTLEDGFDNTVALGDLFVILNKNINLKFYDFGHTFKDGIIADVLSFKKDSLGGGSNYRDVKYKDNDTAEYGAIFNVRPHDKVFIGHRSKFDSVFLTLDLTGGIDNDDYANVAWYLRGCDFLVEYYDGTNWKTASDVAVIPTTVVGINDYDEVTEELRDDVVKYKINFKCKDWFTGGYNSSLWTTSVITGAPSNIDEDEIYLIRITLFTDIAPIIRQFGISTSDEINLAIMWDTNENWFPNLVRIPSGKVIADTLEVQDLDLPLYGIELYCHDYAQYKMIRQARPITKLTGYYGDSLFSAFDFTNIDRNVTSDVVISNPDTDTGLSHFPKNINFHYLIDKILDAGGFGQVKRNLSFLDNFNQIDKRSLSIIGTGYDGTYPIDVGWDAALTNEQLVEYFLYALSIGNYFISTCLIRDDGIYRLWYIDKNRNQIWHLTSSDLKSWSYNGPTFYGLPAGAEVAAIEVVKNKDYDLYGYYITWRINSSSNFIISFKEISLAVAIDMGSIPTILQIPGNHFGKCTVLQLDGKVASPTNAVRLMLVEFFTGLAVDGKGYPTGSPSVRQYFQTGAHETDAWNLVGSRNGFYNPCFVAANYCAVDGSYSTNVELNNFIVLVKTANDKLARAYSSAPNSLITIPTDITGGAAGTGTVRSIIVGGWFGDDGISKPEQNDVYVDGWFDDIGTTDFPVHHFSILRDSTIYNLRSVSGERAFTMVPFNSEIKIMVGVDDTTLSTNISGISIDNTINSWNDNLWYNNLAYEFNELDWWRSEQNNITFDLVGVGEGTHKRLYLGFRKPFNKIDMVPFTRDYMKFLIFRYWDGITWQNLDYIYQGNKRREDSKAHITSGIHFETPLDWVADDFENIVVEYANSHLDQKYQALYWLEVYLDDPGDETVVDMKRFKNCYTNTFLTKGRNLFLLENWTYVKNVYGYPFELDKKVKVDSISCDKESKLILVNMIEDNPYEYRYLETLVFDMFGNFKTTYKVWTDTPDGLVNQHIILKDTPLSIYRKGTDVGVHSSLSLKGNLIGVWNDGFIQDLVYSPAIASVNTGSGYNIPVPSNQKLRKFTIRGVDWELDGDYWVDSQLNNILIAKRADLITKPQNLLPNFQSSYEALIYSLTNSGLLYEELINGPYVPVTPGFYAALEKSYTEWGRWANMTIDSFCTESWRDINLSPDVGTNCILTDGDYSGFISWGDGANWQYKLPVEGYIIYDTDASVYKIFEDGIWVEFSSDAIWPGRSDGIDTADYGIGLEWTLGQDGIKIPYFRPWNTRQDIWSNNNIFLYQDSKVVMSYRHLNLSINGQYVFGHDLYNTNEAANSAYWFNKNAKPTCGVLLPDLTSIKNSDGADVNQRRMDSHSPGIAFGFYQFDEESYDPGDSSEWVSLPTNLEDDFETGVINSWWNDVSTYSMGGNFSVQTIGGGAYSGEKMLIADDDGGWFHNAQALPGNDGLIYGDFSLEIGIQFNDDFVSGNQSVHLALTSQDWYQNRDDVLSHTDMLDCIWTTSGSQHTKGYFRTPNAAETSYDIDNTSDVVAYTPGNWGTMKIRIERLNGIIRAYYDIGGGWVSYKIGATEQTVAYAKGVWVSLDGSDNHGFRYLRFQASEGFPKTMEATIPGRYVSDAVGVNPFGTMGICLHKPYGKVQNWAKAWDYEPGTLPTWTDITDEMNYRDLSNAITFGAGRTIYLGSDTKQFSIALSKADDFATNLIISIYTTSGWVDVQATKVDDITDEMGTYVVGDTWAKKTVAYEYAFNQFYSDTVKTTLNSVEAYWIKISHAGGDFNTINWITCSGITLFDSLKWWQDYQNIIVSDKFDASPTIDEEYRFFDTFVPISIEYDKVRKRLTGCLWNYKSKVNEYYPFVIQFDRTEISDPTNYDNWSWEVEYIEIMDGLEDVDYSKKIQSVCNVSPVSNKAILIDDAKPEGTAKIADIKNFSTGDTLFSQNLAPPV